MGELVSFGLLCGHLVGDYIFQNDWMARNKTTPLPGPIPDGVSFQSDGGVSFASNQAANEWVAWEDRNANAIRGHVACTIHCLLYTFAVALFTFPWMPAWGYVVCYAVHWPIDRFRLAKWFMERNHQRDFATGPLAPWSIIVVDNTLHLVTLYVIACFGYAR